MKIIFYNSSIANVDDIINHIKTKLCDIKIKKSDDMYDIFQVITDDNKLIQGNDAVNVVCDLIKDVYEIDPILFNLQSQIKNNIPPIINTSNFDSNIIKNKFDEYINRTYPLSISNPFSDITKKESINIKNAKENLGLFHDIMDKYKFEYRIIFGTLLGIYRDGDLIAHDQDVDVGIHVNQLSTLEKALPELSNNGFNVTRYSKELLVSLSRNDEYIDIYIFTPHTKITSCGIYTLSYDDFTHPTTIEFINRKFKTVTLIEEFLLTNYGNNWKTPIKGKSANPKNKKV